MTEGASRKIYSTQEQAVASWITYLNQVRLNELIARLEQQDLNFEEAMAELNELKKFIGDPSHILGSAFSKHGEIAEHMQVNIENARRVILGLDKNYTFEGVGRTAPEDYLKNGQQVQSKFYNGLKNTFFNKHALVEHLKTYPDFVKNGGSYDIPKDQYELMVDLLDKYKNQRSSLSKGDYTLAKKLDEFLKENNLVLGKDINPAVVDYNQVQQSVANQTVKNEEKNIKDLDKKERQKAYDDSKPSFKEGTKAVGISAAVEGGVAFCVSVAKKRKEKNLAEFDVDDWKGVGLDTGIGTVKGGIRGGVIYTMTNFTATPANVASAYVTAAFGISSQIKALEEGKVSQEDFIINCETVCLDVTISAIASILGEIIIPVPILGAVIGNVAGEFVYGFCKKQGKEQTQQVIYNYYKEMSELNMKLDTQYLQVVLELKKVFQRFSDLERMAFDTDINVAFSGSVNLALEVGVDDKLILKSMEDIDNYFLG